MNIKNVFFQKKENNGSLLRPLGKDIRHPFALNDHLPFSPASKSKSWKSKIYFTSK